MGPKIKGIDLVYPGSSRFQLNRGGKICDLCDSFNLVD
jgi:hypothetical protein